MTSRISRVLSLALGAALATGTFLATVPAQAAPGPNLIPDANLRSCIANEMRYSGTGYSPGSPEYATQAESITQSDLDALAAASTYSYILYCDGVTTLNGLQYLTDPEFVGLRLVNSPVTDLTPLAEATSLKEFGILNGQVSDLTPLAGLTNLQWLDLPRNQVSDLTPLAGLTNLQSLYLDDNQIGSLAALTGLTNLESLFLYSNQASDLTPLAGLTNLQNLYLGDNQVSDLAPLAGLTNLQSLYLDGNQVIDLAPLAGLTGLQDLGLSNNQISDVTPLAGLPLTGNLVLYNNKISDISPIATFINANQDLSWSLSGNQITDVSLLDWNTVGQKWLKVPSEFQQGVYEFAATNQTLTQTAVEKTTVPLPQVRQAANDPNSPSWILVSGDATIDPAAGTVTYNSTGPVILSWADSLTATQCPTSSWGSTCSPGNSVPINLSFFSGTVSVNVTTADAPPPVPSIPDSTVVKDKNVATTTGGAARVADGTDSYTLVTTVKDEKGTLLTGYAGHLTTTVAKELRTSTFTETSGGTYSLRVSTATPGNYAVTVSLDGTPIGTIPVNFIGADIAQPTRLAGEAQTATGLGFLPGEKVDVFLHSDPISLGSFTADENGTVKVDFTLPKDFALGRHTVEFIGETSGTVTVGFDVVNPAGTADTGGSVLTGSSAVPAFVLMFSLCVAGVFAAVMGLRRRNH